MGFSGFYYVDRKWGQSEKESHAAKDPRLGF